MMTSLQHSVESLNILPCNAIHGGTQKCHCDSAMFAHLGVHPGDAIEIELSNGLKLLCLVWLLSGMDTNTIMADTLVSSGGKLEREALDHLLSVGRSVKVLKNGHADAVEVTVVMKSVFQVANMKSTTGVKNRVKDAVHKVLMNLSLASGYHVNCDLLKLGELSGISRILVTSISPDCQCSTVSTSTTIHIIRVMSEGRFVQERAHRKLLILGGLHSARQKLSEMLSIMSCNSFKSSGPIPKAVLLRGPPGCGKTSLVRMVAAECQAHLISVTGAEVFGSRPGEGEEKLRQTFDEATAYSDEGVCVLFIDEIDALCSKSKGSAEQRMVSQLCCLIDKLQNMPCPLLLVASTNRPSALPLMLRRPGRLDREIFIGIPTFNERHEILTQLTSDLELGGVTLDELAERTPGYVGADLTSLVQQAMYLAVRATPDAPRVHVHLQHFITALHSMTPSSQRGSDVLIDQRPVSWDDVGGLSDVKLLIQQAVEWPLKHPGAFHRLGIPRPTGVLLYGPPGCAKTILVRAAATSCHVTFLAVNGAQLYSPFVGDSERKISEVFSQARAGAPSILFIDEIDAVLGARGGGGVTDRVLAALLTEMDGVGVKCDEVSSHNDDPIAEGDKTSGSKNSGGVVVVGNGGVLVVAATNRPDTLDAALLRPGRLDRHIYVPPPDLQARVEILRVHCRQIPLDGVDLQAVAEKTENFTGADLENLCREAALHSLTSCGLETTHVAAQHFDQALQHLSPSLSALDLLHYSSLLRNNHTPTKIC